MMPLFSTRSLDFFIYHVTFHGPHMKSQWGRGLQVILRFALGSPRLPVARRTPRPPGGSSAPLCSPRWQLLVLSDANANCKLKQK